MIVWCCSWFSQCELSAMFSFDPRLYETWFYVSWSLLSPAGTCPQWRSLWTITKAWRAKWKLAARASWSVSRWERCCWLLGTPPLRRSDGGLRLTSLTRKSSAVSQTEPEHWTELWCCHCQIKEKLDKVIAKQRELTEKWDKHWEFLKQRKETGRLPLWHIQTLS